MAWHAGFYDCCAAPNGLGGCLYTSCCFPCALGSLVDEVVAADPSATYLHGCCGNACCSFIAFSLIPYVGTAIAAATLLPPLYDKLAPPGAAPLGCVGAICCGGCALCQAQNEVAHRRLVGQSVLGPGRALVMAPGQMVMAPVVAGMMVAPQPQPQQMYMQQQPQYVQPGYVQQPQQVGYAPPQQVGYAAPMPPGSFYPQQQGVQGYAAPQPQYGQAKGF